MGCRLPHPSDVFSSVHAGSWLLPLFWNYGLFPSFIVSLGCRYTLVWVLLLSCFGHVRAKNNFVLFGGLELCLTFRLGLSPVAFASSQGCEGIVLLRYAVVGLWTVLAWPIVEGLVNPAVLVWMIVSPGYV